MLNTDDLCWVSTWKKIPGTSLMVEEIICSPVPDGLLQVTPINLLKWHKYSDNDGSVVDSGDFPLPISFVATATSLVIVGKTYSPNKNDMF